MCPWWGTPSTSQPGLNRGRPQVLSAQPRPPGAQPCTPEPSCCQWPGSWGHWCVRLDSGLSTEAKLTFQPHSEALSVVGPGLPPRDPGKLSVWGFPCLFPRAGLCRVPAEWPRRPVLCRSQRLASQTPMPPKKCHVLLPRMLETPKKGPAAPENSPHPEPSPLGGLPGTRGY